MEFRYSSVLDPSTYDAGGLWDDGIPVRVHRDREVEDLAIIRAHEDWSAHVTPTRFFRGGLHPRHSFVSLALPECLPERLDIVSYANELGFLVDDIVDNPRNAKREETVDQILGAFESGLGDGKGLSQDAVPGLQRLYSSMALKMLSIDRERAIPVIKSWNEFIEQYRGHARHEFSSLGDYLEYRIGTIGRAPWTGLVQFGCAFTIPDHEKQASLDLCRPAWIALCLTNDLFSWEKENRIEPCTTNVLSVIMHEQPYLDLDDAKKICRRLVRKNLDEYLGVVKQAKERGIYSNDLLRFLDVLIYSVLGNAVWSSGCPRYHESVQFSEQQLGWITHGIPDTLRREKPVPVRNMKRRLQRANGTNEANEALTTKVVTDDGSIQANIPEGAPRLLQDVVLDRNLAPLSEQFIDGPSQYIASLPGKGVRSKITDAMNVWYEAPESAVVIIKRIIDLLHQASLMLDDLQDGSLLRRGKPATHTIFGMGQTVNSASYKICEALQEVLKLDSIECVRIVIEDSKALYVGQSLDLHWTTNLVRPTLEQYLAALDKKTGGLIRLLTRLLEATSPLVHKPNLHPLTTMLGRAYALRDDYQNLSSDEYTETKGFCDDLNEGKYSLPLLHALQNLPPAQSCVLQNILTQRRVSGSMSADHKHVVLGMMKQAGSLEYTLGAVRLLQDEVDRGIAAVEAETGVENPELRAIVEMIRV